MVREGLDRLGYRYLIIDDCWASKERNGRGELMADGVKFPNGIKAVADYVHSKGLKFGLYSCCGAMTCAGYPGSYQHEFTDAATFAAWGVDCLKYDFCYRDPNVPPEILYRRMGLALANCGRISCFPPATGGGRTRRSGFGQREPTHGGPRQTSSIHGEVSKSWRRLSSPSCLRAAGDALTIWICWWSE
mgnify:CR=1 FL=1